MIIVKKMCKQKLTQQDMGVQKFAKSCCCRENRLLTPVHSKRSRSTCWGCFGPRAPPPYRAGLFIPWIVKAAFFRGEKLGDGGKKTTTPVRYLVWHVKSKVMEALLNFGQFDHIIKKLCKFEYWSDLFVEVSELYRMWQFLTFINTVR